jgi:SAM-dependent methyltransferase
MAEAEDVAAQRAQMLANWERAAVGWKSRAERVREHGMPVSLWMVERLSLQPGMRVLELAAGPGDTGFLAAELVRPGGRLISSDASEPMLDIARARAADQGIDNVEFKLLQLEWIDLPTASVDAALCRWGVMLSLDPAAALHEIRRVVAPGGRFTAAVWDLPERNPWTSIPAGALIALGHAPPPEPGAPGMFALAAPGRLEEMLGDAGFVESHVEPIPLHRTYESVEAWLDEMIDLSVMFGDAWRGMDDAARTELAVEITRAAEPFTAADGSVTVPGSTLVALAES